jgi:ABC-type cobalamin/Fe3+-siderophores transport system ATPase subunit
LFKYIASIGNLVVLSIHDVNLSLRFCDHILMLKNNKNYRCGKAADIMTAENITDLYDYPFTEIINQHSSEKIFIRGPLLKALMLSFEAKNNYSKL